jgi:signal transduction histidine kinase
VSSSAEVVSVKPARWPWTVLAAFLGVAAVSMVLVVANDEPLAEQLPFVVAFAMFGVVGALIVSRDRGNTIGLLFLWAAFLTATSFLAGELLTWAVNEGHTGLWVSLCGYLNNFGWLVGILPTVFLLPLLFPDGHIPSPRWRPLLWFILAFLVVLGFDLLLGQRTLTGSTDGIGVANPIYVDAVGRLPSLDPLVAVLFPGIFAASVTSLILRFRRSTGVERQQIKWVVYGLSVALVGIVATTFTNTDTLVTSLVDGLAFLLFPASIGVAILRFRLYDLDVVVRKTLIYGAFALFATLIYLAVVVGVGAWLGRDNSLLTMAAAVVVAVTFQPARDRLTRFANRVVYGKRATPYEILSEFSERVGDTYAEEDVLPRMVRVLGEGVGAERADVWLVVDRELRDVAAWPSDEDGHASIPLPNGSVPRIDGMDRVYPVEHAGELLGALAVRKPSSDPLTPADEKLVADLASQAGLVLRNVRLSEALKARLGELKAAQKRLVTAQDAERRRLERNIHDGAQQQLVALAVKARLARSVTERDPAKATEMLVQIEAETQQAMEDLRDLARGIYPPLLADKGLSDALTAQARKSVVTVDVDSDGVGRYPQEVEAAVYFSVLEALQNVTKYAEASRAVVRLREDDGMVTFEVRDEGVGFDPRAAAYGTGLQGMADRLAALDGTVDVISSPGEGTTVRGRIPAGLGAVAP